MSTKSTNDLHAEWRARSSDRAKAHAEWQNLGVDGFGDYWTGRHTATQAKALRAAYDVYFAACAAENAARDAWSRATLLEQFAALGHDAEEAGR